MGPTLTYHPDPLVDGALRSAAKRLGRQWNPRFPAATTGRWLDRSLRITPQSPDLTRLERDLLTRHRDELEHRLHEVFFQQLAADPRHGVIVARYDALGRLVRTVPSEQHEERLLEVMEAAGEAGFRTDLAPPTLVELALLAYRVLPRGDGQLRMAIALIESRPSAALELAATVLRDGASQRLVRHAWECAGIVLARKSTRGARMCYRNAVAAGISSGSPHLSLAEPIMNWAWFAVADVSVDEYSRASQCLADLLDRDSALLKHCADRWERKRSMGWTLPSIDQGNIDRLAALADFPIEGFRHVIQS